MKNQKFKRIRNTTKEIEESTAFWDYKLKIKMKVNYKDICKKEKLQ